MAGRDAGGVPRTGRWRGLVGATERAGARERGRWMCDATRDVVANCCSRQRWVSQVAAVLILATAVEGCQPAKVDDDDIQEDQETVLVVIKQDRP